MKTKKFQLSAMMLIQFFLWKSWYATMATYFGQTLISCRLFKRMININVKIKQKVPMT